MAKIYDNLDDILDSYIGDGGSAFFGNESDLRQLAEILKGYLKKWIRNYFDNYTPTFYGVRVRQDMAHERQTRNFENSILVRTTEVNGQLSAEVYFDVKKAYRDSLFENEPKGFIPSLLNNGWYVKNGTHRGIPHFGHFYGARFIEATIADAQQDPRFEGVDIIPPEPFDWY